MKIVSNGQSGVEIQLGLWDALVDLFSIEPNYLFGFVIIGILLAVLFRKNRDIPKVKTAVISLILYYYLCLLCNIVGTPTLSEFVRLSQLGEAFFHPNINIIPLSDGFSLSFILNILLFIPLGLLCPLISRTFERARNMLFVGLGLSMFIEILQLFTLYRATDINDLLTNIVGTMIGYLCFRLAVKLRIITLNSPHMPQERDGSAALPIILMAVAFGLGFFS